jgi:hypothetical protein
MPGVLALLNYKRQMYHLRAFHYSSIQMRSRSDVDRVYVSPQLQYPSGTNYQVQSTESLVACWFRSVDLWFDCIWYPSLTLGAQSKPAQKGQTSSAAKPSQSSANRLLGTWRVARGMVAPWVTDKNHHPDTSSWIGKVIRFDAARVSGPEALNCGNARYEPTSVPAEGMFQGTLSKSPSAEAVQVGVSKFPIPGTSLTCDTGIFEFHFPDSTSALLAMSNAIWTLDRSPGAMASATIPAGVVQRFLEAHFARDMGFTPTAMQRKMRFVTPALYALMTRYFALPANPNEAPDINGDPFTNSQEYPTRFSVGDATVSGLQATVRVRLSDAFRVKNLTYQLRRENTVWRIDDVKYDDGTSLRAQLTAALPGKQ